jgi:hypothetical protein
VNLLVVEWQVAVWVIVVNQLEVTVRSVLVRKMVDVRMTVAGVGVMVIICVGWLHAVVTVPGARIMVSVLVEV